MIREEIKSIIANAFADTSKNWSVTFQCKCKPGESNDAISPLTVIEDQLCELVEKEKTESSLDTSAKLVPQITDIIEAKHRQDLDKIYQDILANGHITAEEFKEKYL